MGDDRDRPKDETICFCFGHTREQIVRDFLEHGHSRILEEILAAKRLGACRCAVTNPRGT